MFKHSIPSLLLLTACLTIAAAGYISPGETSGHRPVITEIRPRLLFWNRRNENSQQQPIVIVQPNSGSDNDRHRPHWPEYYPYPYPSMPHRPSSQYPGLNEGGGPSIIIINPSNAQNISFPAAAAASTTSTTGTTGRNGGYRRNSIPLIELLQGVNAQDDDSDAIAVVDNESEAAAAAAAAAAAQAPLAQYGGGEERDEDLAEDELALLERQAARGLSTKHLLSFLMQDKRRRRFQEAVAGIYLRNYNQNRK